MTHPPTEAQAPTPEPSEEDRESNPFAEMERWNEMNWQERYEDLRRRYDELQQRVIDAGTRALSPSPDTRMGEVVTIPRDVFTEIMGKLEGFTPPENEQDWICVDVMQKLQNAATTRLAASSEEVGKSETYRREVGNYPTAASSREGGEDALKRIERLAYGYELMHRAICNMAGTSGADGRWYMQLAQEAQARVSPVWDIGPDSNPHKPGDCLTGYRSAVPNRAALASPAPMPEDGEAEVVTDAMIDAALRYVRGERDAVGWAIEAALSSRVSPMPETEVEYAWVIEGAWSETCAPDYWVGGSTWTSDNLKALRFARKEDAQQAADLMCSGLNIRICEHAWG